MMRPPPQGNMIRRMAATNARKMLQRSIVSSPRSARSTADRPRRCPRSSARAALATISGSATNPDLNDPKFAQIYRPAWLADLLPHGDNRCLSGSQLCQLSRRGAEAAEGRGLDDGGAYGVGMADAFAAQAAKKGMTVLIRDRLDPLNADYTAVLTRAKKPRHAGAVLRRRSVGWRESGEAVL